MKACSATLRRVSLKFAAYDLVEMERARSELQMHREGCASAIAKAPYSIPWPLPTDRCSLPL